MRKTRSTDAASAPGEPTAAHAALAGDLLMLLRLAMTDAPLGARESAVLRRMAAGAFGFAETEADELCETLGALNTESDVLRARAALRRGGRERNLMLAELLCAVAAEDPDLKRRRPRLGVRIADILGLAIDDLPRACR